MLLQFILRGTRTFVKKSRQEKSNKKYLRHSILKNFKLENSVCLNQEGGMSATHTAMPLASLLYARDTIQLALKNSIKVHTSPNL